MQYLRAKGIQTSIHYPPIHLFSYYKKLLGSNNNLPLTECVGRRKITLPLFPTMREDDVIYVVSKLKEAMKKAQRQKLKAQRQKIKARGLKERGRTKRFKAES